MGRQGSTRLRDANNKSALIHDPERAFLVRMLFEDYAKGCLSISGDLVQRAREWGLRNKTRKGGQLSASQIQHILMNPFYYGAMRVKDKLYPHIYPPLISQDLFDRCEAVRLGRARQMATRYSEKPFVFRGLVKCAVSGRTVTCDLKKGRHVYLICRDPANPTKKFFVPESEVLDQSYLPINPGSVETGQCASGAYEGQPRGREPVPSGCHRWSPARI
jgi:site-specific DNA recombinase